jgi:hypothetical protein
LNEISDSVSARSLKQGFCSMPVAANPALDFLDEHFSLPVRRQVPVALRRAYGAVDQAMSTTAWLQTPSAKFHRGDLIVHAVEFELQKLTQSGALPFEATWEHYAAPTGKHLVLRNEHTRITINQIAEAKKPRKAVFRDSFGLPNMGFLFNEWNEENRERAGLKHTLLLHGYQDLQFAFFAIPDPAANRLIEYTDNLLKIPHPVDSPVAPEEGPTTSPDPESIEEVVRFINDNDDEQR